MTMNETTTPAPVLTKEENKKLKSLFSFRARVLVMFCGILLVSQSVFFTLYDQRNIENAHKVVFSNLNTTVRVFERLLNDRFERLTEIVTLLASDFGFRSAIAMAEQETIYSMMENHSQRVGADMMLTFDTEGELISTYPVIPASAVIRAFQPIFKVDGFEEKVGERLFAMVTLEGKPFQLVIVPIRAPELISYAAVGFTLTNDFAGDIKNITDTEVSFVSQSFSEDKGKTAPEETQLLISTNIASGQAREFTDQLKFNRSTEGFFSIWLNEDEYVTHMVPVFELGSQKFFAVMQKSWEDVLRPYTRHRPFMITIAVIFLGVSVLIGVLLSRQVTRPVLSLVDAVKRVEKGNYDYMLKIERNDEIGMLTVGFNRMLEGLAERDRMKYLALHDGLTGLPNRRLFNEAVEEAIRRQNENGISSAVLLIDLDGFKPVNDTYGHAAGDAVLKNVGSRLSLSSLREEDLAARLGGDEFAVLYNGINDPEVVKRKAEKILKSLNEPMHIEGHDVRIGASIGISMTHKEISASEWLEKADSSCYVSKNAGKNAFCFEGGDPVTLKQLTALRAIGHEDAEIPAQGGA